MKKFLIYNSRTRSKEAFDTLNPRKAGMYVCGITPYSDSHLGHGRCYVVFDTLRRFLEYLGYEVRYIQNVTDIDDKIINKSIETGEAPGEISRKNFELFIESMEKLNVLPADIYPKVTDHIPDIIEFVKGLIEKEFAYEKEGSVYFRVSSLQGYGRLSGREAAAENDTVSRVSLENEKSDSRDFAVWKKDEEYGWESPWGKGRPGWHIECSAMSRKLLGDEFDIHGGGLDLIFPHHENEVAQSRALTGKEPARFWIHNGMVTLKGDKMSKSTGNFFLLNELLSKIEGPLLRLFLLSTGYRQVLDFSIEKTEEVRNSFLKLKELKKELDGAAVGAEIVISPENPAVAALLDDFNTPRALGEVFKVVMPLLEKMYSGSAKEDEIRAAGEMLRVTEDILGISLTEPGVSRVSDDNIEKLIAERNLHRRERRFAEADAIREELSSTGVILKDTPSGTKWVRERVNE